MSVDRFQLFITLLLYSLPGMVVGFTLHELMHAVVADRLGDPLPRSQGRLSLDPLTQIDPLGFALLYGIGFGFARPVQINTMRIRTDAQRALVAVCGPLTNLVIAILCGLALRVWTAASPDVVVPAGGDRVGDMVFPSEFPYLGHGGLGYIAFWVLYLAMFTNALLFVFNMIPIPPLDGFSVFKYSFRGVIPAVVDWMEQNRQILMVAGIIILFVLPRFGDSAGGSAIFGLVQHITDVLYSGVPPAWPTFISLLNALS